MTERPIIFSGPMVRALLDGRKTQTRRLAWLAGKWTYAADGATVPRESPWQHVAPGDRLWVRETVACGACATRKPSQWSPGFWRREQGTPKNPAGLWYAADGLAPERPITERGPWVPSIHMPRWASRLTLTVTAVRVQRLQDISATDAEAEGIQREDDGYSLDGNSSFYAPTAAASFAHLWRAIHGADAWDSNPFVVAITFTVSKEAPHERPISDVAAQLGGQRRPRRGLRKLRPVGTRQHGLSRQHPGLVPAARPLDRR